MKRIIISFLLIIFSALAFGQGEVDQLIKDGISLHRKGDYSAAITKFDEALKLEPTNGEAMFEKTYSLLQLKHYDEALDILKKILKESKDPDVRRLSYVSYGTILDFQGDKKKSIKIYEEGIKEFPQSYLLYYNKGITEAGIGINDDAIISFQNSVRRNPMHGSSHNALGILVGGKSRIPGIMSTFSFLLIEPEGDRAKLNLTQLDKFIMRGISQKDEKNITISLDRSVLDKKKSKEDDFSSAELMLSLIAARVPDSLTTRSEAELLGYRLSTMIAIIDETDKKDKGFYKNFYVPFFVDMKKNDFITTACYIAMTSSGKDDIINWQKENKDKVDNFFDWLDKYKWPKE
jgi:tetratricopeptide (TPR) repeat protein